MQKVLHITLIVIFISLFSGCSSLKFPGVYLIKVQQGNYIEQEMVDQLKEGMTKRQVRYVMGSPLVEDTFNAQRWDYYFSVKRGDKILKEQHFIVHFEDDKLVRWEGTYEPAKTEKTRDDKELEKKAEKDRKQGPKNRS